MASMAVVLVVLPADPASADGPIPGLHGAVGQSFRPPPSTMVLTPGEYLPVGRAVASPNGRYRLTLELDGRLVLSDASVPLGLGDVLWSNEPIKAVGAPMPLLLMRPDGELALYDTAQPGFAAAAPAGSDALVWSTDTRSASGATLQLGDDGTLSVVTPQGRALWRSGNAAPDVGLWGSRHIVYDRDRQWVWLIDADGSISDNYPVSGHAASPVPGSYKVTSKSEDAISYDWALTMRHMVRFTTDTEGDWIGFHSIPRGWRDTPVQTEAELGDYLSLGCVRQRDDKAERLFNWAHIGTPVVVLA